MPQQINAKEVKEKIFTYLEMVGPSLPIHVAKHLNISTLFASAFLSEMIADGNVKVSSMKVGGSPLYYTQSKVNMLENFSNYLGSKEKEALSILKEKKVLKDYEQTPVIRVALRSLKDFAFSFNKNDNLYWKYFQATEEEINKALENKQETKIQKPKAEEQKILAEDEAIKKELNEKAQQILEGMNEQQKIKKIQEELLKKQQELDKAKEEIEKLKAAGKEKISKKLSRKKSIKKQEKPEDSEFLSSIKTCLKNSNIELVSAEMPDKKQAIIKARIEGKETIIFAFDKKRTEESDIIKAYRKSLQLNLPYMIISKGELSKKTEEALEAYKKLKDFRKIE